LPRPTMATPSSWPDEAAAAGAQRSSTGDGYMWERGESWRGKKASGGWESVEGVERRVRRVRRPLWGGSGA
jgi:hypothetical protein